MSDKVKIIYGKLDRLGKKWDFSLIALTPEFSYKKPVIDEAKILSEEEKDVVEHTLKNEGRKLVHIALRPIKNDYKDDYDRGTVNYTSACRNYSFHKVVIPDSTTIKEANFTQRIKRQAIEGKNLRFEECNLVNNIIDPTWILVSCNTTEVDFAAREAEELARLEVQ